MPRRRPAPPAIDRSHPAGHRTPVAGTPAWEVTSFDGTRIRAHWFPVHPGSTQRSPTILMGPGSSLSGDTDPGIGVLGEIPIKDLWAAGTTSSPGIPAARPGRRRS